MLLPLLPPRRDSRACSLVEDDYPSGRSQAGEPTCRALEIPGNSRPWTFQIAGQVRIVDLHGARRSVGLRCRRAPVAIR
jgi:hypothetical protein